MSKNHLLGKCHLLKDYFWASPSQKKQYKLSINSFAWSKYIDGQGFKGKTLLI